MAVQYTHVAVVSGIGEHELESTDAERLLYRSVCSVRWEGIVHLHV